MYDGAASYYYIYILYAYNADDAHPGGHTVFKLLQVNTINSNYWLLFGLCLYIYILLYAQFAYCIFQYIDDRNEW